MGEGAAGLRWEQLWGGARGAPEAGTLVDDAGHPPQPRRVRLAQHEVDGLRGADRQLELGVTAAGHRQQRPRVGLRACGDDDARRVKHLGAGEGEDEACALRAARVHTHTHDLKRMDVEGTSDRSFGWSVGDGRGGCGGWPAVGHERGAGAALTASPSTRSTS